MTHHELRRRVSGKAVNVGGAERVVSALLGGFLALKAAKKGGLLRTLASGYLVYRGATGHCGVYKAAGINTAEGRGILLDETVTVNAPVSEVYSFWRNLENLPEFMEHLEQVKVIDSKRSHWVAAVPGGIRIEWDAEIIGEHENEYIAWRSLPYSDIDTHGSVEFSEAPGHRGTVVRVRMQYDLPGTGVAAVTRLLEHITFRQLRGELLRFKELIDGKGRGRAVGE
ncbi:MAG: DUF2892 domain-containing protein [Deltaproteobacteria bacterium]|nr:DUF2892 domain-containing protein [Deltaproteobacteria bacterium]